MRHDVLIRNRGSIGLPLAQIQFQTKQGQRLHKGKVIIYAKRLFLPGIHQNQTPVEILQQKFF